MTSIDILSNDVENGARITPIVLFANIDGENPIYLSRANNYSGTTNIYGNIDSISSIKESIDIENRKYKVSSVTLQLNNDLIGSNNLSNLIYNHPSFRLNSVCTIKYHTPSMGDIISGNTHTVYSGKIREIKNTIDKVQIVLEDSTQQDAHKDLPSQFTSEDNYIEKYRNKPIPMVYGTVPKSPCIIDFSQDDFLISDISLIFGSNELFMNDNYIKSNKTYLGSQQTTDYYKIVENTKIYIGENGSYLPIGVAKKYFLENNPELTFKEMTTSNRISFNLNNISSTEPENGDILVGSEELISHNLRKPKLRFAKSQQTAQEDIQPPDSVAGHFYNNLTGDKILNDESINRMQLFAATDPLENQIPTDESTNPIIYDNSNTNDLNNKKFFFRYVKSKIEDQSDKLLIISLFDPIDFESENIVDEIYLICNIDVNLLPYMLKLTEENGDAHYHQKNSFARLSVSTETKFEIVKDINTDGEPESFLLNNLISSSTTAVDDIIHLDEEEFKLEKFTSKDIKNVKFGFDLDPRYDISHERHSGNPGIGAFFQSLNINSFFGFYQKTFILKPFEKEFYADVRGKYDVFTLVNYKTYAENIVKDIIENELGLDTNINNFDNASLGEHGNVLGNDLISKWDYAFTQDKTKNSKKIIEELLSYTQLFPYFKNNIFELKNIKKFYEPYQEITNSKYILDSKKIKNYSFSRTDVRNLYTDIEFNYYYDFSSNSYKKNYTISALELFPTIDYNFVGVKQKTLKKDCRFIYDEQTAVGVAQFLLASQCNQHTYIDLTLDLQYIYLKVGDNVRFPDNKLLDNKKVYGENYTLEKYNVQGAGQTKYNLFKIVSTNISDKEIKVVLYQLHDLRGESNITLGCTNPDANNYDPSATIDDGSCQFEEEIVNYGCTDETAINFDINANVDNGSCVYYSIVDPPSTPKNIKINGTPINEYESTSVVNVTESLNIEFTKGDYSNYTKLFILATIDDETYLLEKNFYDDYVDYEIFFTNDTSEHGGDMFYIPPGTYEFNPINISISIRSVQNSGQDISFSFPEDQQGQVYFIEEQQQSETILSNFNIGIENPPVEDLITIESTSIGVEQNDEEPNKFNFVLQIEVSGLERNNFLNYLDEDIDNNFIPNSTIKYDGIVSNVFIDYENILFRTLNNSENYEDTTEFGRLSCAFAITFKIKGSNSNITITENEDITTYLFRAFVSTEPIYEKYYQKNIQFSYSQPIGEFYNLNYSSSLSPSNGFSIGTNAQSTGAAQYFNFMGGNHFYFFIEDSGVYTTFNANIFNIIEIHNNSRVKYKMSFISRLELQTNIYYTIPELNQSFQINPNSYSAYNDENLNNISSSIFNNFDPIGNGSYLLSRYSSITPNILLNINNNINNLGFEEVSMIIPILQGQINSIRNYLGQSEDTIFVTNLLQTIILSGEIADYDTRPIFEILNDVFKLKNPDKTNMTFEQWVELYESIQFGSHSAIYDFNVSNIVEYFEIYHNLNVSSIVFIIQDYLNNTRLNRSNIAPLPELRDNNYITGQQMINYLNVYSALHPTYYSGDDIIQNAYFQSYFYHFLHNIGRSIDINLQDIDYINIVPENNSIYPRITLNTMQSILDYLISIQNNIIPTRSNNKKRNFNRGSNGY